MINWLRQLYIHNSLNLMLYKALLTQGEAQGAFKKSVGVFLAVPKVGTFLFLILP